MKANNELKFSVIIEFVNYWNEVIDSVEVARFCSMERAEEYLKTMDEDETVTRYRIKEL